MVRVGAVVANAPDDICMKIWLFNSILVAPV